MTAALDVLCLGEALVDLLPDRRGALRDCERFEVHSGGAPANVAVGLARLGLRTGFAGVVGDDEFGRLLERKLAGEGIALHLRFTTAARTGLWFVALDERGERTFFAPTGAESADKLLESSDVARLPPARFLHCGSSAHIRPVAQRALVEAIAWAQRQDVRVSFDPNVRAHLWPDLRDLAALCEAVLPRCHFVKLSEEEIEPCLGVRATPDEALRLLEDRGVAIGCITLGERGAIARSGGETVRVAAPRVDVVDTTGAGDGFVAGVLAALAAPGPARLPDRAALERALQLGCAIGSRVCTRLGAVQGLPRREELQR